MEDTVEINDQHRFEPGSIVMLKSGGPGLTVLGSTGDRVQCVFFSEEIGEFRETSLPMLALTEAVEDDENVAASEDDENEDEDEAAESSEDDEAEEDDGDQPGDNKTAAAA